MQICGKYVCYLSITILQLSGLCIIFFFGICIFNKTEIWAKKDKENWKKLKPEIQEMNLIIMNSQGPLFQHITMVKEFLFRKRLSYHSKVGFLKNY